MFIVCTYVCTYVCMGIMNMYVCTYIRIELTVKIYVQ